MKVYNEAHLNVLTTTKDIYINQLNNYLEKFLYEGINKIYNSSLQENKKKRINIFKNKLSEIPNWNIEILDNQYNNFIKNNDEQKFERLIKAIFCTYTKILSSVKVEENKITNITINIPNNKLFIHKCYIEIARNFYKNPYLFDNLIENNEKHSNLIKSLKIIKDCIIKCIEKLLPIDDIISENFTYDNKLQNNN